MNSHKMLMLLNVYPAIVVVATLLALGAAVWAAVYYATYAVRSQWLGATVWRGPKDLRAVALTFDDGPAPDTAAVLDTLQTHGVKATFFMVGRQVEQFPALARRVAAEGHEIGNHSYSHPIYLYCGASETKRQLEQTQEIIAATTGTRPRLARPPCGVRAPAYFAAARALGLQTAQWSVAGFDWQRRGADEIARAVLRRAQAGDIILLHDGDSAGRADRRATVAALPLILAGLQEKGLRVAPLAELLASGREAEPRRKTAVTL